MTIITEDNVMVNYDNVTKIIQEGPGVDKKVLLNAYVVSGDTICLERFETEEGAKETLNFIFDCLDRNIDICDLS